jgi:hypothetical protein
MILYFLSGMFAYAVLGHVYVGISRIDEIDRRYSYDRDDSVGDARDVCSCSLGREVTDGQTN